MFRRFAANSAHGDALDLSPLGEVGQLGLDEVSGSRGRLRGCRSRAERRFSVGFDVIFADTPTGAGALDRVDVDADFAGQTTGVRSRGNWLAMLGSGDLVQLNWHRK